MTAPKSARRMTPVSAASLADLAAVEAVSALSQLNTEVDSLQRQIDRMSKELEQSELRNIQLTEAKFVTFQVMIASQADKVALALEATEKAIDKAERATEKAIDKAEAANDKRFASVNEFRAQLADMIARLATLERVDLLHAQTQQRINEVNENLQRQLNDHVKMNQVLSTRVTELESFARGAGANKNSIIASIGAVGVLIGILVVIMNMIN